MNARLPITFQITITLKTLEYIILRVQGGETTLVGHTFPQYMPRRKTNRFPALLPFGNIDDVPEKFVECGPRFSEDNRRKKVRVLH